MSASRASGALIKDTFPVTATAVRCGLLTSVILYRSSQRVPKSEVRLSAAITRPLADAAITTSVPLAGAGAMQANRMIARKRAMLPVSTRTRPATCRAVSGLWELGDLGGDAGVD